MWSQVASWIWDRREDVAKMVSGVVDWFRRPTAADGLERGILILGPGGVGKTTLARIVSGQFDWLHDDPWRYRESLAVEQFRLADDERVAVVVPPGQTIRRGYSWDELLGELATGRYRGVILVTANGYHTLGPMSYKTHPLYDGNKDGFVAAYTESSRQEESAVIRRIAPHLLTGRGKMWLLSVVTKEDLWFPARAEVDARVRDGELSKLAGEVSAAKGASLFRFETVATSLVIGNFVTSAGELLAKNVAGYDHRQAVESVRRLFEVLNALRVWEDEP